MKKLGMIHAVLCSAILLSGCLPAIFPQEKNSGNADFSPYQLESSDFGQEISGLLGVLEDSGTTHVEKTEAHRRLAILYLSPRNPDSDFDRAVAELGKFLEIAPGQLDKNAAASWATALESGAEYRRMKEQYLDLKNKVAKLDKNNRQLNKENKNLDAVNVELQKTIEKLKKLDLSLEKKEEISADPNH